MMICKGQQVSGNVIDGYTRCAHYHTELDIIAIKFYCCDTYFPCYQCHEESGCGRCQVWPREKFDEEAVLCGACGHELTVNEYLECNSKCPSCNAGFNPGCRLHRDIYFEA